MPKTKLPLWLLREPDQAQLLRRVAEQISLSHIQDPAFQVLIDEMVLTMHQARGVGLAAPQIGQSIRLAVIDGQANEHVEPYVLINPSISQVSSDQIDMEEGCLSIPRVFGVVPRANRLTLSAFDRFGKPYRLAAEGFFARVIQHELDHLNGKLYIDRATEITSGKIPT